MRGRDRKGKEGLRSGRVESPSPQWVLYSWLFAECSTVRWPHSEWGVNPIFHERNLRPKQRWYPFQAVTRLASGRLAFKTRFVSLHSTSSPWISKEETLGGWPSPFHPVLCISLTPFPTLALALPCLSKAVPYNLLQGQIWDHSTAVRGAFYQIPRVMSLPSPCTSALTRCV